MKTLSLSGYALSVCVAAALLAGCGGSHAPSMFAPQIAAPQSAASRTFSAGLLHRGSKTFYYTGAQQDFTVPNGVTSLTVTASAPHHGSALGGFVQATIPVAVGENLAIFVGGISNDFIGGFNGGVGSGSGASDVRQGGNALTNRVVVAGGSGGVGSGLSCGGRVYDGGSGGAGGNLIGGNGGTGFGGGLGGFGGTQAAGGQGGGDGGSGALGVGGYGGRGGHGLVPGGGGGGGYYGGGGGSSGMCIPEQINYFVVVPGGGGGGSSYAEPSATNVTMVQGGGVSRGHGRAHRRNGNIVLSW